MPFGCVLRKFPIGRVWRLSDRTVTAMFTRHLSGLESVAFTPAGQTVLSRGRDSNLYMWSADGGYEQAAFLGHRGPINDAVLSPDRREVLTASDDGTARLWDARVNAGPVPSAFASVVGHHAAGVNTVAFSPDGSRMLSAGDDGTARLWRPGSRVTVLEQGLDSVTGSIARQTTAAGSPQAGPSLLSALEQPAFLTPPPAPTAPSRIEC